MEKLGVISRVVGVEEPIQWCAAMVVVPKPSGSIRICVDLHEASKRECYARGAPPA